MWSYLIKHEMYMDDLVYCEEGGIYWKSNMNKYEVWLWYQLDFFSSFEELENLVFTFIFRININKLDYTKLMIYDYTWLIIYVNINKIVW